MKSGFAKRMHQKRKIWIISILVVLAIPAIYLLIRSYHEDLFREPNPNGYQHFLLAVAAAPSHLEGDYNKREYAQLLARSHAQVFEHVRAGLAEFQSEI